MAYIANPGRRSCRDDIEFVRALAPLLADGARRALLLGEATDPDGPQSPGLAVLSENWDVSRLRPASIVGCLSCATASDIGMREGFPSSVQAVAGRALRAETREESNKIAIARVPSRSGRWIVLHGAALLANGSRRVAVVIEAAHPARISELLMSAYGLTDREQDVTRLVLRGDSTAQIARRLVVSPHTAQQHLKSVLEKTGVHSRRELVGKVFFAHFEPRVRDNERRAINEQPLRGGPFPP